MLALAPINRSSLENQANQSAGKVQQDRDQPIPIDPIRAAFAD
jgi:hypothetical protein